MGRYMSTITSYRAALDGVTYTAAFFTASKYLSLSGYGRWRKARRLPGCTVFPFSITYCPRPLVRSHRLTSSSFSYESEYFYRAVHFNRIDSKETFLRIEFYILFFIPIQESYSCTISSRFSPIPWFFIKCLLNASTCLIASWVLSGSRSQRWIKAEIGAV